MKHKRAQFWLSKLDHKKFSKHALEEDRTKAEIVREIIKDYFDKKPESVSGRYPKVSMGVEISPEYFIMLEAKAKRDGTSISAIIRALIKMKLSQQNKQDGGD